MASFWSKYRKRLAFLVLVVAALVIGHELSGAALREVELVYDLGPDHAEFVEVRVAYVLEGGDEVAGVRFHEEAGLPSRLDHQVELSPGRYTVEAVLTGPSSLTGLDCSPPQRGESARGPSPTTSAPLRPTCVGPRERRVARALRVPTDGRVHIDLFDAAYASRGSR